MTGKGRKAKGHGYERHLAKVIGDSLGIPLRRTPLSGALDIKGDLREEGSNTLSGPLSGWTIEAKKQERLSIWSYIKQARRESGGKKWMVIFSRNREKDYVCLELESFLPLLKGTCHE